MGKKKEWIYCEDRLPEREGCYLTFHVGPESDYNFGWFGVTDYCNGWNCRYSKENEIATVVAWMPLPKKPRGKQHG